MSEIRGSLKIPGIFLSSLVTLGFSRSLNLIYFVSSSHFIYHIYDSFLFIIIIISSLIVLRGEVLRVPEIALFNPICFSPCEWYWKRIFSCNSYLS